MAKIKLRRSRRQNVGVVDKVTYPRAARTFALKERQGDTKPFVSMLKATTAQAIQDPYNDIYGAEGLGFGDLTAMRPPYDLYRLAQIPAQSNALRQCIDAMITNIESYGFTLEYIGPEGKENRPVVQDERKRLRKLFHANGYSKSSFREIRERLRADKETLGYWTLEVFRDDDTGEVVGFDHVPAISIRKTRVVNETVEFDELLPDEESTTGYTETRVMRKFRRYIQSTVRGQRVYFKEFGDPRRIDSRDGQLVSDEDFDSNRNNVRNFIATEILMDGFYVPGNSYGMPRWIGVLPAILGSRESEVVNLNFFRDNAIPAMAVLVSGGALTADSFAVIEQYINAARGQESMQRVMVLEAAADELGSTEHSNPAPKIDMKPMISERQQEGLFQEYDQKNMQKVRSVFRLPPIYAGRAEDYTKASAFASMQVAETQIFVPERSSFDDLMNNKILITKRPKYYRFKSLGPSITEPDVMANVLKSLGDQGALTPNVVIKIANKMLDIQIEPVMDSWGDYPFAVIMELVKGGATIEGLDEFIKSVANANPAQQPGAGNPATPARPGRPRVPAGRPSGNAGNDNTSAQPRRTSIAKLKARSKKRKLGNSMLTGLQTFAADIKDAQVQRVA